MWFRKSRSESGGWLRGVLKGLWRRAVHGSVPEPRPRPARLEYSGLPNAETVTPALVRELHEQDLPWLRSALEELDEPDRELIMLRFVDGLPDEELAGRLQENAGQLRHRAYVLLNRLYLGIRMLQVMEEHHMPFHLRKVACWRHFREWPASRIATELGCAEPTVNSWLESCRHQLPSQVRAAL